MQPHKTMPPEGEVTEEELAAAMRRFIRDQAECRTDQTVARYVQVADDLDAFLAGVDVGPWLGAEIAAGLEAQRQELGADSFLPSLGLLCLIRVLPAFVATPWLPPAGPQRRTHRVVVRHLLTFLRRECIARSRFRRNDFTIIAKAVDHANMLDYPQAPANKGGLVTSTVTLDLADRLVDALLEQVMQGAFETLDEAIAARLNPVETTYREEPDQALPYGW